VTLAYIGIGSNLDDPRAQVTRAFEELAALPRSRLAGRSSLYRSAPIGYAAQPDFCNAVAAVETALGPRELLGALQRIEGQHGRARSFANAPRTLDLDLLLFGEERVDEPGLTVPHPRMHERAFVLLPLTEVDPQVRIPGRGSAAACLAACGAQRVSRIGG
jgi:2-amino-4-hydroxy-6-hydroxymethyldihydropteridine diphosphokinase